jgi:hypothetical protein
MDKIGNNLWNKNITNYGTELKYRYNRNNLGYSSAEEFSPDSWLSYRVVNIDSKGKIQEDTVQKWRHLSGREIAPVSDSSGSVNIVKRDYFERGIGLVDYWWPSFSTLITNTNNKIKQDNANWVMITGQNSYNSIAPLPSISLNTSMYQREELINHIKNTKKQGLNVMLKLRLCCNNPPEKQYDHLWWDAWFADAQKVLDYYSGIAQESGADALLIDYSYGSGVPGGFFTPKDGADKWEAIIKSMRVQYGGQIGFNTIQIGNAKTFDEPWPSGARKLSVDFIGVELWGGIGNNSIVDKNELDTNAEKSIGIIQRYAHKLGNKPIVITGIAYASVAGCSFGEEKISANMDGLRIWDAVNPSLTFDPIEQAQVYDAYLKAIASVPEIKGVYSFGYWFMDFPDSYDYSIRGKEAENVVKNWYAKFETVNG